MSYKRLGNTWNGLASYDLNGPENSVERYGGPVTLSLPQWQQYVSSGFNTLYGAGGVIPGGTMNTPFGGSGAVYRGLIGRYGM